MYNIKRLVMDDSITAGLKFGSSCVSSPFSLYFVDFLPYFIDDDCSLHAFTFSKKLHCALTHPTQ